VNTLLVDQLREVIPHTVRRSGLASESSLRVAARTLASTAANEMTATRVIGSLGQDDVAAFEALVARISQEYGLQSRVQLRGGSFAVRFSRD
jgi:hypothetical protein